MPGEVIGPHGGYRKLKAYQLAEAIYDATAVFTRMHLNPRSRTVDQMVQAARSGKQNIAEGTRMSGTSKKSELKLIGVARASLEELLLDYEDFLRQNNLSHWPKEHKKAVFIRKLRHPSDQSDPTDKAPPPYDTYRKHVETTSAEDAANTITCVIHQANYLLDQLKRQLESQFLEEGGFTEKLYQVRSSRRKSN